MFAVVKKGKMYVDNYKNVAKFKNKFGSLHILEYANTYRCAAWHDSVGVPKSSLIAITFSNFKL